MSYSDSPPLWRFHPQRLQPTPIEKAQHWVRRIGEGKLKGIERTNSNKHLDVPVQSANHWCLVLGRHEKTTHHAALGNNSVLYLEELVGCLWQFSGGPTIISQKHRGYTQATVKKFWWSPNSCSGLYLLVGTQFHTFCVEIPPMGVSKDCKEICLITTKKPMNHWLSKCFFQMAAQTALEKRNSIETWPYLSMKFLGCHLNKYDSLQQPS